MAYQEGTGGSTYQGVQGAGLTKREQGGAYQEGIGRGLPRGNRAGLTKREQGGAYQEGTGLTKREQGGAYQEGTGEHYR